MGLKESLLDEVRKRDWFYEFELPDGSRTASKLPPAWGDVHGTRARMLGRAIHTYVEQPNRLTALDIASHQGFFSIELARHFQSVHGFDVRESSVAAAQLMAKALDVRNVDYSVCDVMTASAPEYAADFVLLYGLLYHLENPIQAMRVASRLSRRYILIETQILPVEVGGKVEDGHFTSQRDINGVFALCNDYPLGPEGGTTELALVPSLAAVLRLMEFFGFKKRIVIEPEPSDYEQYTRRQRVVVFGDKAG